jgi:hypothetical protein
MQTSVDPSILTSSPLRQLYEDLSLFEANRDWSKNARVALIERVTARSQLPAAAPPQQPDNNDDVFLFQSMLEDLGVTNIPERDITDGPIPAISHLFRSTNRAQPSGVSPSQMTEGGKSTPTLTPQLASAMTAKELATFAMLQLFGELSEQRIESWGRVARLIVTQPMDGFATVRAEDTTKQ